MSVTSGSSVMVVWGRYATVAGGDSGAGCRSLDDGEPQTRGGRSGTKPGSAILLAVLPTRSANVDQGRLRRNVVGGVKVTNQRDLALLLAMVSSLRDRPPQDSWCLSGAGMRDLRPVPSGRSVVEAAKHGFRRRLCLAANVPKVPPKQVFGAKARRRVKRV